MKNLEGVKIALCQMNVTPGRPDINTVYIVGEIETAVKRGVDIIVFPEMSVTGYFIGDLFEDESFLQDVAHLNQEIRKATANGIIAIVGTSVMGDGQKGEDGLQRLMNAAVIYGNGRYLGHTVKTLQPNYRVFEDDRHFYSNRKLAFLKNKHPSEILNPFAVKLKDGREINLGVILCEDMWHDSYPISPAEILAKKCVDVIINLSASPWTWQKNRKRHQIVKKLSAVCDLPFVYVNNTGIQNTGKNIIIFDGSSTIYNSQGERIFEISPYKSGSSDFIFADVLFLPEPMQDDTKELYEAMNFTIKEFFRNLPPEKRKMIIGLSGGIDSSLSAALYADALGSENVVGINMPSKFNSEKTKNIAKSLAENLGIVYEVRPIQEIVDAIASASSAKENTLTHENIQARTRMEILAARAQDLNCLYSANWNKIEAAFGYGTLYGDMAGGLALIGDLVKREVYQLADYLNKVVFNREVIPQECIDMKPTAELRANQFDPFDYGRIDKRGYHEEMVRAFTEFRKNPEWFLKLYKDDLLESEMKLEAGSLKKLFRTARHFIYDLEKHWRMFCNAYFKRLQGPPIPIVSKRAFGTDLRESIMRPHFTGRYFELREALIAKEPKRIAVYGGSFNPPGLHHREITVKLLEWFDEIFIVPCGARDDKNSSQIVSPDQRRQMIELNFNDLPNNVVIDNFDLDNDNFTPTFALVERYKKQCDDAEVWYVVGGDLIVDGKSGNSEIQRSWKKGEEVWQTVNFFIITRPGFNLISEDLPPSSEIIEMNALMGSSTLIRNLIKEGKNYKFLLKDEVYEYIEKSNLYKN